MKTNKILLLCLPLLMQCGGPRVGKPLSFTEVQHLVAGKTADEVENLLGKPDFREPVLENEERWVWWNHAVLDGREYAPELRGQVVHLEITFQLLRQSTASAAKLASPTEWRVQSPFGVSYSRPSRRD